MNSMKNEPKTTVLRNDYCNLYKWTIYVQYPIYDSSRNMLRPICETRKAGLSWKI